MFPFLLPVMYQLLPFVGAVFAANSINQQASNAVNNQLLTLLQNEVSAGIVRRAITFLPALPFRAVGFVFNRLVRGPRSEDASTVFSLSVRDGQYSIVTGPEFQTVVIAVVVKVVVFGVVMYISFVLLKHFLHLAGCVYEYKMNLIKFESSKGQESISTRRR